MSSADVLVGANRDEFVSSLAALALYDGDAEVSADNIKTLLAAAKVEGVKPYWPVLMAGALKNGRIETIIFSGASSSAGAAPAAAAPAAGAAPAKAAEKKEEKKKEEEVDVLDGGMDMFGGGGEKTGGY